MRAEDFALCMKNEVLQNLVDYFEKSFKKPVDSVPISDWHEIVILFNQMGPEQQEVLSKLLKIAIINAVSYILGILDGTTLLAEFRDEFVLTYGDSEERLNGDLQAVFFDMLESGN